MQIFRMCMCSTHQTAHNKMVDEITMMKTPYSVHHVIRCELPATWWQPGRMNSLTNGREGKNLVHACIVETRTVQLSNSLTVFRLSTTLAQILGQKNGRLARDIHRLDSPTGICRLIDDFPLSTQKVCSLAAETALLSGTFQPPLDAAAFYKKRIWIWRSQPQCQVVRGCPSPLANSLQLLLQDGSVVVLDSAGNFQRRITLCIGALGARAVCSLGVALCTFSDSVLSLYDLENGELLQELPLKGSFRGLLPALWGFWTDTGLFRLAGGSRWSPGPPSELQSEALLYAARHAGAHALLGPPDNTQVGTRLSRILRPLVECYWKLQLTRSALVS